MQQEILAKFNIAYEKNKLRFFTNSRDPVTKFTNLFVVKNALIIMLGRQTGETCKRVNEHVYNDKDSCTIHNHTNDCDVVKHLCFFRQIYMLL